LRRIRERRIRRECNSKGRRREGRIREQGGNMKKEEEKRQVEYKRRNR
jgi:hypothetical protein